MKVLSLFDGISCGMVALERTGVPVGYTACLKNKEKRGKGIGNGWTVDVIAHILKGIMK